MFMPHLLAIESSERRCRGAGIAARMGVLLLMLALAPAASPAQVLDVRELHPAQLAALDRSRTVVLLVGGILEEHGTFLPSYSDGYQTDFIATRLAEAIVARPGWTVLRFPPIPLGTEPASDIGRKFDFPGSYGIRSTTLRAVYMDLLTDLGEQGFKWGFILNLHGGPLHERALDDAARYFCETYGGRMVNLTGLSSVAGAVPHDLFSPAQREAEGFSVHADADEHSRMLFLRPDLVSPEVRAARPVIGHGLGDLVALAARDDWPGYFGTPAIGTAAAGARAMAAIAQATIDAALRILDGAPDSALVRAVSQLPSDRALDAIVEGSLQHEHRVEQQQGDWLARSGAKSP